MVLKPFKLSPEVIKEQMDAQASEILVPKADSEASEDQKVSQDEETPIQIRPTDLIAEKPEVPDIKFTSDPLEEAIPTDVVDALLGEQKVKETVEKTEHFQDRLAKKPTLTPSHMMKLADEYIASKNYYLARKACRQAIKLGAPEAEMKEKLARIRMEEFPDSAYAEFVRGTEPPPSRAKRDKIIEELERDYALDLSSEPDLPDIEMINSARSLRAKINDALTESDDRMRLDLGIAFYEMGFFEEAETQFLEISDEDKSFKNEGLYLAAQSMTARGEYLGAVELLYKLSREYDQDEPKKISIYYLLGEVYENLNQLSRSKKYFEKVADLDQNYRSVQEKLET